MPGTNIGKSTDRRGGVMILESDIMKRIRRMKRRLSLRGLQQGGALYEIRKETNKPIIDLNMDLNELFREFGLGEPIIDTSLSLEETMERFLKQKTYQVVIGTAQCQNDTFIQAHA